MRRVEIIAPFEEHKVPGYQALDLNICDQLSCKQISEI